MTKLLFHKDVYMPEGAKRFVKWLVNNFNGYELSEHLANYLKRDSIQNKSHKLDLIGIFRCLESIENYEELFEVELEEDINKYKRKGFFVSKYVIRVHYDTDSDISIAIRPEVRDGIFKHNKNKIITAWLNDSTDSHKTLEVSNYCSKEHWFEVANHDR